MVFAAIGAWLALVALVVVAGFGLMPADLLFVAPFLVGMVAGSLTVMVGIEREWPGLRF